jgi:probable rRNA maturation factor
MEKMGVLIDSRQKKYRIPWKDLKRKAQAVLNALGYPDGELSILLLNDPQMAVLNKKYLQREGPTNVIAFPMREGSFADITPDLLGDVVISLETAAKEGEAAGISMEDRLTELLIHGILHLCGYDHEASEKEALRMEEKNQEILKIIGR